MTTVLATRLPEAAERIIVRQVFETWSIELPADFDETFDDDDAYWHAYDAGRSILAVDGRILLATITSDDEGWTRRTWLSIRRHPVVPRTKRGR